MMLSAFLFAATLASYASANLGKNTLFKNGLHDPLSAMDNSYNPPNSHQVVAAPQICVDHARDAGCNTNTIEAWKITYGDCSESWTLCRCDNANMNMYDVMYRFGQIPVGVRSYVGSVLATYSANPSAGSGGDFIVFNGDCAESVYVHEAGHSLDQGTSPSQAWKNAIAQSSCVPDDYANSSEAEDFAQNTVLYTYSKHIGNIPADTSCLQPQLNYFDATARLRDAQTTSQCYPDKRPYHLSATASSKFAASKTAKYVPIKATYFPNGKPASE